MSLITAENFFVVLVGLMVAVLPLFVYAIVMHLLMPRVVLERYWKPPHFRPMELALFTNTVYAPMRTVMFMWALAIPAAGKKRQLTEVRQLVPTWYRFGSALFGAWVAIEAIGIVGILLGLSVHSLLVPALSQG